MWRILTHLQPLSKHIFLVCNFFSVLLFTQLSHAQSVDQQFVTLGDELYAFGAKKDALDLYLNALQNNENNIKANYMVGKCYLETINKKNAAPYLLKAYELNNNASSDILFKIGMAFQYGAEFDKAIEFYKKHKENFNETKAQKLNTSIEAEIRKVNRKIEECENGKIFYGNPQNYTIENLKFPINTEYSEYAPVITADQSTMIFTARRDGGFGKNKDVDNEYFEDVWMTKKKDGKWQYPKNLGKTINTESHDASIGFSPDGTLLFLYKPDNNGDIYFSKKLNDTAWSPPQNMGFPINSKYMEPSVCISANGKILYFSSDRPGGYGGLDIYKSLLESDGKWGKPINLGGKINTEYDEDSPYIDIDGTTLYFSSKGLNGMGGFDIYMSKLDPNSNQFQASQNLGYPINSPDNDIYFVISGDGKTGYYASAKEGGFGENDIYSISLEPQKEWPTFPMPSFKANYSKEDIKPLPIYDINNYAPFTIFKGKVMEEDTKKGVYSDILTKPIFDKEQSKLYKTDSLGNFEIPLLSGFDYAVEVQKEGYLFYSDNLDIPKSTEYQLLYEDIYLKKVIKGSKIILKNVFFDSGKSILKDESKLELELLVQLLNQNPKLKIEVAGHSDNVGTDQSNKVLSETRAKAVYDFLIKKGIDAGRMRYVGYGKSKPITENDTEQGRQKNRRTEFEIIEN